MLAIRIKLHSKIVPMRQGEFHTSLKPAGQSEIHRQWNKRVSVFVTEVTRCIPRAIIDNNVIYSWSISLQVFYGRYYVRLFVVGWYYCQNLHVSPTNA